VATRSLQATRVAGISLRTGHCGGSDCYTNRHRKYSELSARSGVGLPTLCAGAAVFFEARLSDDLMRDLLRAVRRLEPAPKAVLLFGSVARGARDFRDVDLLCVVSKERDKEPLHEAVAGDFAVIRRRYKTPISAIIATEPELRLRTGAGVLRQQPERV
jgi:hypothetical protein